MPNGKYFLQGYAYDESDNLIEVARRFIKYRERVEKIRQTAFDVFKTSEPSQNTELAFHHKATPYQRAVVFENARPEFKPDASTP